MAKQENSERRSFKHEREMFTLQDAQTSSIKTNRLFEKNRDCADTHMKTEERDCETHEI